MVPNAKILIKPVIKKRMARKLFKEKAPPSSYFFFFFTFLEGGLKMGFP